MSTVVNGQEEHDSEAAAKYSNRQNFYNFESDSLLYDQRGTRRNSVRVDVPSSGFEVQQRSRLQLMDRERPMETEFSCLLTRKCNITLPM